jgi:cytochrome c-type biogenesis protein CcmE
VTTTEAPVDLSPVEPPRSPSRSRRRSIIVLVVVVGAILALLSQGLLSNLNYFDTVAQAMGQRAILGTSTFRLEGLVATGSIEPTSLGTDFYLDGSRTDEVRVVAVGNPPELFQANIPVVVDGHFTTDSSNVFDATQIIVRHTSTYIANYPGRVKAPNGSVR